MKKILLAILLIFVFSGNTLAVEYYLSLNQDNPHYGQNITFNGLVPQDAMKQAHNSQFHNNPYTQIICSIEGTYVLNDLSYVDTKSKNSGDVLITTTPFNLSSPSWTSGGATCSATEIYWTYDNKNFAQAHVVATTEFEVLP